VEARAQTLYLAEGDLLVVGQHDVTVDVPREAGVPLGSLGLTVGNVRVLLVHAVQHHVHVALQPRQQLRLLHNNIHCEN
jgi:hypothetical protein